MGLGRVDLGVFFFSMSNFRCSYFRRWSRFFNVKLGLGEELGILLLDVEGLDFYLEGFRGNWKSKLGRFVNEKRVDR